MAGGSILGYTMLDGDLYERFECIDPPRHCKFYELEVELVLFYPKLLIRRWGKIGTHRPRELRYLYSTQAALRDAVEQIRSRRVQHGYHLVYALPPSHSAQSALTSPTAQVA